MDRFVAYHEPWWETLGITTGRSVTDLPVRQVYYWASNPKANSVLLATYDDTLNVGFWQGLAGDVRQYTLTGRAPVEITGALYMPYPQSVGLNRQIPRAMALVVRSSADPSTLAERLRRLVPDVSPAAWSPRRSRSPVP